MLKDTKFPSNLSYSPQKAKKLASSATVMVAKKGTNEP
jgi:hypothetical protein